MGSFRGRTADGGVQVSHGGWGRSATARYAGRPMSTRKLILAALLCGMAILVAFTVQIIMLSGSS